MKTFLSWSGESSEAVASALRAWLPQVIQRVEPWMSQGDIAAGQRWGKEVAEALEASQFGIVCVTPGNTEAPWVAFEAGAMASRWEDAYVCPYLHGLAIADLPDGPLTQFQAKVADEAGTRDLLRSINAASGDARLADATLDKAFDKWWPELQEEISGIDPHPGEEPEGRDQGEMLEEIVEIVRELRRTSSTVAPSTWAPTTSDWLSEIGSLSGPPSEGSIARALATGSAHHPRPRPVSAALLARIAESVARDQINRAAATAPADDVIEEEGDEDE